ncbi:MAG: DUF2520 domain-containing protein [Porticoccaceae bacterium]|nr:DUF2520 domain-containing protein [Porticoccaceae bacterium]
MVHNKPPALNIIGAGRLGRSLARLWHDNKAAEISAVCNRSLESASEAVSFIGAGTPCASLEHILPARLWLIATPDRDIETTARYLAQSGKLRAEHTVFHCSGSLSSDCLESLQANGTNTASIHPVHSFADPQKTQTSFDGSYCAMEGSEGALNQLEALFQAIGGVTFRLHGSEQKALYHSATVMACNYLVTLQHCALNMLQKAGIERNRGLELLAPIVRQTADNIARHDTTAALTGPIARGDINTIEHHMQAIEQHAPEFLALYRQLAQQTLPLAAQQGCTSKARLQDIEQRLQANPSS